MTWETIHRLLAELDDDIVAQLAGDTRRWISAKPGETLDVGEDVSRRGGNSKDWVGPSGYSSPDVFRRIVAYKNHALGWHVARLCALRREPLPSACAVEGSALTTAWLHLIDPRWKSHRLDNVMFWMTESMASFREILNAMLLSYGATIESVSKQMQLDPEDVTMYEQLFFSIMDRKSDTVWLQQLVYPNTAMVEFYSSYVRNPEVRWLLRRAGHNHGPEHVLKLAGIMSSTRTPGEGKVSAEQLEAFLLSQALLMAQAGWANSGTDAGVLFHSRQLMTAAKMSGQDAGGGSTLFAELGDALLHEMNVVKLPEATNALRLRQIDAEAAES